MTTPRNRARPSAILFDMDGLLIDSERVALDSLEVAATKLSLEFPAHVAQRLIGLGRDGGSRVIRESLGDTFPLDAFWQAWSHDYLQRIEAGVPAKDAVSDTLAHLAELGVPMAVATSTETPWAKKKLLKAGIHHFFDHIVGRDLVASGKPSPDLYLEAATRLRVRTEACWAFEDSLPGLRAAIASGARTHWVPDVAVISAHELPDNVETVTSLRELKTWLV